MKTLSNMKTFYIVGYYKICELNVYKDISKEIKAENIAKAIEKFNSYNRKIYGADISTVTKVFELVWNH